MLHTVERNVFLMKMIKPLPELRKFHRLSVFTNAVNVKVYRKNEIVFVENSKVGLIKLVFKGEFLYFKNMLKKKKEPTEVFDMKNSLIVKLSEGEYIGLEALNQEKYSSTLKCYSNVGIVLEINLEVLGDKKYIVEDYLKKIMAKKTVIVDEIVQNRTALKEKNQLRFYEVNLKHKLEFANKNPNFIKAEFIQEIVDEIDKKKKMPKIPKISLKMDPKLGEETPMYRQNKLKSRLSKSFYKDVPVETACSEESLRVKPRKRPKKKETRNNEMFVTKGTKPIPSKIIGNLKEFHKSKQENLLKTGYFRMPMVSLFTDNSV